MTHRHQVAALAAILTACAGTGDVRIEHTDPATRARTTVTASPDFYASGCARIEVSPNGTVTVLLSQDGSSDWAGLRAIVAIVPDSVRAAAAAVTGSVEALISLFPGWKPRPRMAPRSEVQGCDVAFEPATEAPNPGPEPPL